MTSQVSLDPLDLALDPERRQEFVESLFTVESESSGVVPWKCTTQQSKILKTRQKIRKLLVVKGRQTRCSTIIMVDNVVRSITGDGQNFVVITQTDEMTQNFRTFIKRRFEDLANAGLDFLSGVPGKPKPMDNEKILEIQATRCRFFFASAESKVGLRGIQTAHHVHASEVAHWPEDSAKRIMGGILPASPATGTFVAESTPNGAAGWFYDKCSDAMPLVPVSLWTVAFYPWWLEETYNFQTYIPVLQDAGIDTEKMKFDFIPSPTEETLMNREGLNLNQMLWRRLKANDLITTGQYFAQEYPEDLLSCWLASGIGFFHDDQFDHLAYYRERCKTAGQKLRELKYRDPSTGVESNIDFLGQNLEIWEPPLPGHRYVAFQDVSAGVSGDGDYSALVILDANDLNQVAQVRVRTLPGRVGAMAAAACAFYNWAYLGVERNSYGLSVLEKVQEMHYPNLYYDVINQPQEPKLGWFTSPSSRELMLNRFREQVFNHRVKISAQMAVMEMGAFTWKKVQGRTGNVQFRAEAERGNDDLVIALAGACAIAPYAPTRVKSGLVLNTGSSPNPEDVMLGPGGVVMAGRPGAYSTGSGFDGGYPWLR